MLYQLSYASLTPKLQPRFLRLNRLSRRSQREVRQRSLVFGSEVRSQESEVRSQESECRKSEWLRGLIF